MKQLLIILICAISFSPLWGQSISSLGTPEQRAEKITKEMEKEIPLEESQVDSIQRLNLKYAQRMEKEFAGKKVSKWTLYKKGKTINKEKEKELKGILNKKQFKNYEKMKARYRKELMNNLF